LIIKCDSTPNPIFFVLVYRAKYCGENCVVKVPLNEKGNVQAQHENCILTEITRSGTSATIGYLKGTEVSEDMKLLLFLPAYDGGDLFVRFVTSFVLIRYVL